FDTFGGVRLSTIVGVSTRPPVTLTVPAIGGGTGASAVFTTDFDGGGGARASPPGGLIPRVKLGDWGVGVSSVNELNKIIQAFNQNNAGKLTPSGQALVAAGIFTEAQMRTLKAVVPTIPLVPTNNPNPFPSNAVNFDIRVSRPINLENAYIVKNLRIEPYFDVFNLFNRRGIGAYSGLGAGFGALNFDYSTINSLTKQPFLNDLRDSRAFRFGPRTIQFGFRFNF